MATGQKNIEEIIAGDEVWAWDEESETVALKKVTATMQREVDATVEITLEGETIETLPNILFTHVKAGKMPPT